MKLLNTILLAFLLAPTSAHAAAPSEDPPSVPAKVEEAAKTYASSQNLVKAAYLQTGTEVMKLEGIGGTLGTTYAFVTMLLFADFPDPAADVKISDPKATLYLISSMSPKGRIFLVKAESQPKKNKRSVKMGKAGAFGYSGIGAPDPDWVVEFAYEEIKPGIWKVAPKKALVPGEYGIYLPTAMSLGSTAAGELFGFSVVKK